MLNYSEISELEAAIMQELPDKLLPALTRLNRTGEIETLLKLLDLKELLDSDDEYEVYKTGKIVVIGQSDVKAEVLLTIAGKSGIDKARLELYLDYNDAKKLDLRKMQWNPTYSVILAGPMPHSGASKGDYSSVLTAIENEPGYPPVVRLGETSLKITKSQFQKKMEELLEAKIIA